MIFAASIVYFEPQKAAEVEKALAEYKNIEVSFKDVSAGKMIIVTEAESETAVEDIRKAIMEGGTVQEISHHAFYFGEEVEKLLNGEMKLDIDFETLFKKHNKA